MLLWCFHLYNVSRVDGMYRRSYDEVIDSKTVPLIPVQPISYEDAVIFLRYMYNSNNFSY